MHLFSKSTSEKRTACTGKKERAAQKAVKATGGVGRRPMMTLQTSIEVRIIAKRNSAGFKEKNMLSGHGEGSESYTHIRRKLL